MHREDLIDAVGKPNATRLKALGLGLRVGKVLGDRVLVRAVIPFTELDRVEKEGFLYVPPSVKKANTPPPSTGIVIQVGPLVKDLTPGDMIMFSQHAGGDYKIDREDFKILEEREVMCTLEEAQEVVQPVVADDSMSV